MTNRLKENSISVENSKDLTNKSKLRTARPNIDHLIKRILNERRKEQKKNFLIHLVRLTIKEKLHNYSVLWCYFEILRIHEYSMVKVIKKDLSIQY